MSDVYRVWADNEESAVEIVAEDDGAREAAILFVDRANNGELQGEVDVCTRDIDGNKVVYTVSIEHVIKYDAHERG